PPSAGGVLPPPSALQRRVEGGAHHVDGHQVEFLDGGGPRGLHAQGLVAARHQRVGGGPGEGPHPEAGRAGGVGGGQQVGAGAAGGQQHQHVAGPAVRADLAGEDGVDAVVVGDGGGAGGVGVQGDRGERGPVVAVAADEFGGQVLGLGRAGAVAGGQQPAARREHLGEAFAPPRRDGRAGAERHEGAQRVVERGGVGGGAGAVVDEDDLVGARAGRGGQRAEAVGEGVPHQGGDHDGVRGHA